MCGPPHMHVSAFRLAVQVMARPWQYDLPSLDDFPGEEEVDDFPEGVPGLQPPGFAYMEQLHAMYNQMQWAAFLYIMQEEMQGTMFVQ